MIHLSICICTYKRNEDLTKCLDSLAACEPRAFEVIVSDDAHDEACRQLVENHNVGARYVTGPGRGLAANRNNAIRSVSGTHISFLDDDTTADADFVKNIGEAVTEMDKNTVITGYEMRKTADGYTKVTAANANFLGYMRVPPTDENRCNIVINATVFPAAIFQKILFDERLIFGCEEIDIARQCRWVGYQIRFDESVFVHHHHSLTNRKRNESFAPASRIYSTFKNYFLYERDPVKALFYLFVGSGHLIFHRLFRKPTLNGIFAVPSVLFHSWKNVIEEVTSKTSIKQR